MVCFTDFLCLPPLCCSMLAFPMSSSAPFARILAAELTRLRAGTGSGDDLSNRINNEIVAMEQEAETQAESRSICSVVTDRSLLLPVVLVCAAQCGQQLSGVNAVFYYSVDIFIKAGLSHTSAKWANFGAGCLNLATSLTGPKIMEKCDRRPIFMYRACSAASFWCA